MYRTPPIRGIINNGSLVYLIYNQEYIIGLDLLNPINLRQYTIDQALNGYYTSSSNIRYYYRDLLAFRMVLEDDQSVSFEYAGDYKTILQANNLYIDSNNIGLTQDLILMKYLPFSNVPTNNLYVNLDYSINQRQYFRLLPVELDSYFFWNGRNSIQLSTFYQNQYKGLSLLTNYVTTSDSFNSNKLIFPKGLCLSNQSGILTEADNGCIFTSTSEVNRQYWYNYCNLDQKCGDNCFGSGICNYVNGKFTPNSISVNLAQINRKIPITIIILLIIIGIIIILIIILAFWKKKLKLK